MISLRRERNLGSTRMQAELLCLDGTWLSTSTIHRAMAAGRSRAETAIELALRPTTVSTYRARAKRKLDVDSNAALVRYAITNGLVE